MKNISKFLMLLIVHQFFCACDTDDPPIEVEQPETFEYFQLNIIVDQEIPNDPKIDMVLEEILTDNIISYNGSIERRGGFSFSYPKHSYEIDFKADIPFANLPPDDDWILNANYIDKTFMRHTLSYDLFREMNPENEASQYKYTQLSLNGAYNGLYVIMEKLDRSSLGVDKDDINAVIFKEPPLFHFNLDAFVPQYPDNYYQQTFPRIEDEDKTEFIVGVRDFIMNSSNTEFSNGIDEIFDIGNIIDWHLLLLVSNNGDGILKNFYLYKLDSFTPLRVAPWDYDYSFGRDGDNELNLIRPADIERSNLLCRLLEIDWYKNALKNRWIELNDQDLISPAGLKARIETFRSNLKELVAKNCEKWPVDGYWYYDDNCFDEEIEIMFTYIDLRHEQLTTYFNAF